MNKITKGLAIVGAILIVLLAIIGLASLNPVSDAIEQTFGGTEQATTNYQVMAGTPDRLTAMPYVYVDDNTTTTGALQWDASSGGIVNQDTEVSGITQVGILAKGLGGTGTSTLFIKLQGSMDGTNFFDITSTTDTLVSTTTVSSVAKVLSYDFGTATSSKLWVTNIPPVKWLRTLFYGDRINYDSDDGVQAYIQITKIQ